MMINFILETAPLVMDDVAIGGIIGSMVLLMGIILIPLLLIGVGVYIYSSLAYATIGRKAKHSSPNIAWIPIIGKPLLAANIAMMHWWPLLLLLVTWIPLVGGLISLAFAVFNIIWNWKMMKVIGRPGWWAIFILIYPVYLILLGIAAWGNTTITPKKGVAQKQVQKPQQKVVKQ